MSVVPASPRIVATGPRTSWAIMLAISARPPTISWARSVARRAREASARCATSSPTDDQREHERLQQVAPLHERESRRSDARARSAWSPIATTNAAAVHGRARAMLADRRDEQQRRGAERERSS